jgi:hypothetical protein
MRPAAGLLASSFSGVLRGSLDAVCGDCGWDPAACPPIPPATRPMVLGPLYGRMKLYLPFGQPLDVVWNDIEIPGP